jgi:hypothetical protein
MYVILEEMVEPLEETRSELIFATEPILSSLQLSIPGSSRYLPLVQLDEVEVSILQIHISIFLSVANRYRRAFCSYAKALSSCTHQLGSYTLT